MDEGSKHPPVPIGKDFDSAKNRNREAHTHMQIPKGREQRKWE
jgi:hypothetical protein